MRYPISWLRQFVHPKLSDDVLAERLTMAGLEVEAREEYGNNSPLIVVAEVMHLAPHPEADRLQVCQVRISLDEQVPLLNIVCGAANVVVGMIAPLALIGAKVQGKTIVEAALRGVVSQGMLCSAEELNLGELSAEKASGLLVLPEDLPVGKPLNEVLPTSDTLLTIKLTPNRGDCLSMLGLAREVSALTQTELCLPAFAEINLGHDDAMTINLDAGTACPVFAGRIIKDLPAQRETPLWMRIRLVQCGERPINPLVDITNFVMLELGQPMHAFDRQLLKGQLAVRPARVDEHLALLSGQTINLQAGDLLVTDDDRPIALAGVMGGAHTAIALKPNQPLMDVFFEAAHFAPTAVQGRTKAYGLTSQAAYRFERGVDPRLPEKAINRATELTLTILGGRAGPQSLAYHAAVNDAALRQQALAALVPFRLSRAQRLIGYPYTAAEAEQALMALGFSLEKTDHESSLHYAVKVPTWRFDVHREEDLIEEVARMVGYDNVAEALPINVLAVEAIPPHANTRSRSHWDIARQLAHLGYRETQHFGFISEDTDQRFCADTKAYHPIKLANPIAENLNVMRQSLLGSLLETAAAQVRHQVKGLRLFEIARVFQWQNHHTSANVSEHEAHLHANTIHRAHGQYHQPYHVAMLAWGMAAPLQWGVNKQAVDFFDLKGDVETLIGCAFDNPSSGWQLGTKENSVHPALHPTRSAPIFKDGQQVGWLGALHPLLVRHYHLTESPIVFECALEALITLPAMRYQSICRQPVVERDLSVLVAKNTATGDMVQDLKAAKIPHLLETVVFDVYDGGAELPTEDSAQKSLAFRFWLQSPEKTLADTEISTAMHAITERLQKQWQAKLREATTETPRTETV